jgi:hypothetical protein
MIEPMLHRDMCGGAAFYTRWRGKVCDKVAKPRETQQSRPFEPVQTAPKRNGFLQF